MTKFPRSACPYGSDTRRARTSLLCSSPRAMHAVLVARNWPRRAHATPLVGALSHIVGVST